MKTKKKKKKKDTGRQRNRSGRAGTAADEIPIGSRNSLWTNNQSRRRRRWRGGGGGGGREGGSRGQGGGRGGGGREGESTTHQDPDLPDSNQAISWRSCDEFSIYLHANADAFFRDQLRWPGIHQDSLAGFRIGRHPSGNSTGSRRQGDDSGSPIPGSRLQQLLEDSSGFFRLSRILWWNLPSPNVLGDALGFFVLKQDS